MVEGQRRIEMTALEKRKLRLRNYWVGGGVVAFVAFVYLVTWIKIANKTF